MHCPPVAPLASMTTSFNFQQLPTDGAAASGGQREGEQQCTGCAPGNIKSAQARQLPQRKQ